MRSLLLLALLLASAPGCCCVPHGPPALAGYPALASPADAACRVPYTPGYRRPCFPAYRPIDSVSAR